MARADRRRAAREAARAPRRTRAAGGGAAIAEDTLFFPKLRAHAKWMFVLLAIVFAGGFVFLGVGSGSGIGDLLSGNIGNIFGSGTSVSDQITKDRSKIKKNPKDITAYRDLASALRSQGKTDEAIAAYNDLLAVAPKDADALAQVAGLYLSKGDAARARAQAIQTSSTNVASSDFLPSSTSKIGQALNGTADPLTRFDPINSALSSKTSTESSNAYSEMSIDYGAAVASYKKLAAVNPTDPSVEFQLAQAAEQAGDTKTAIAAYQAFLKLAPDDPTAPAIKARLKQLGAKP
ncbi:MAG: tetratricopeptide repeat protein [Gaiellaceae bacterium]